MNDEKVNGSETTALALRETVAALQVVDKASYDLANEYNARAYATEKAFHEFDDPVHDPIVEAWQKSCARRKKVLDACKYVKEQTGSKQGAWMRAEQAKAEEARRKAEEAARKIAEEAQIKAAEALQAEGLTNAAEAVLDAPTVIPKIVVSEPEKAEGVYYIDRFSAEVVDLMELVKAVAEGKAPIRFIEASVPLLNSWARDSKGAEALPGVKIVKTTTQGRRS